MKNDLQFLPPVPPTPTNRHSVISLILGILTLLALCGGLAPVPFTGFICFPASFLLGVFALVYGFISLSRIRKSNEKGHHFAWTGIVIGGFILLCMIATVIAILLLLHFAPQVIPPFIPHPQI